MKHPQKRRKLRKGQAPAPITLRDKLIIWAWLAGAFLILTVGFHVLTSRQQRIGLDKLTERWRHEYHLTDEPARRVRALEESFHGSGSPFTRPAHTQADTREHA